MTQWVAGLLSVLGVVLAASTAVAYFRAGLAKATIETLRESNDALTARNGELDAVIMRLETRLSALERENEVLRSALGGKADVERVVEVVEHHHEEVMADRRMFEDRFTTAMVVVGEKLDANRKGIRDVLSLLGDHRRGQPGD